jgi:cysteine-rich secretory family protein
MTMAKAVLAVFVALSLVRFAHAGPLEDHVLDLVNLHRTAANLPPLSRATELDQSALEHSTDMAAGDFMSHIGSNGSTPQQRVTAAGYQWTATGENIAVGHTTAQWVVDAWMGSPGHRANILNPKFKEIGIAVIYRPGACYDYYWTQDFGARSTQTILPVPPISPTPTPVPMPMPGFNPNLVSVQPRMARSGAILTLTGNSFGSTRGTSRVFVHKRGTLVYAAIPPHLV